MLDDALEIARTAAETASRIMRERFEMAGTVQWKSDGSPVTEADIEINRLTMQSIETAFPDHGFIGEELGEQNVGDAEYVWLCDPIDGTRPFSAGLPLSTFSLALTRHGEPVLGVLAYPARNWMFVVRAGEGAFLNGERLSVSSADTISGQTFDLLCPTRLAYHVPGLFDAVDEAGGVPVSYGSTAIAAAFVARGVLAGSVWGGATPWDAAAVKLIVEEAGGKFTDLWGNDQRYDHLVRGFIASNGLVHAQLVEMVQRCGVHPGKRNAVGFAPPPS